ncbi:MAG TPA: hypothetical protein VD978_05290 [Azospirillum sp.]|nr:hypothetical protein [Azospirillum sp.]
MAKPRRTPPTGDQTGEPAPATAPVTDDEAVPERARLSAEEIAFLLGGAPELAEAARAGTLRAERNIRSNARRTGRRHADPAYAEHLRTLERERQRRRRAKERAAQPASPTESPVPLPPLTPQEAAKRLAGYIRDTDTPQTRQLRRRPELVTRYVAGFVIYRLLSADGARPTRGAMADALRSRFGLDLTPSQVQKLRDQIEGFAGPNGPWQAQ